MQSVGECPCKLKGKVITQRPLNQGVRRTIQVASRNPVQNRVVPTQVQRTASRNPVQTQQVSSRFAPRRVERYLARASVAPVSQDFTGGGPACANGIRIEAPLVGTRQLCSGLSITITSADGKTVSWTASGPGISSITVKGGSKQNVYTYGSGVTSDTDLASPLGGNGQLPGVSHVDICFTCPSGSPPPICGPGSVPDCKGICGGPNVRDCGGACYDPQSEQSVNTTDCKGTCYKKGDAPPHIPDCKGICFDATLPPPNAPDCKGVCGGTATPDCKGICGGPAYEDCSKTCITPCDNLVTSFSRQMGVKSHPMVSAFGTRRKR